MESKVKGQPSSPVPVSRNVTVGLVSTAVVLLLLYPWLVLVTFLAFVGGYSAIHYFDSYSLHFDKLVERYSGVKISTRRVKITRNYDQVERGGEVTGPKLKGSLSWSTLAETDPLSSQDKNQESLQPPPPKGLQVPSTTSNDPSDLTASPAFTPTPYRMPKIEELNLKIDPRLDASISKFISSVFDYYVGPEWAPYLTRRQLKLAFKQLLTNLGEVINGRLQSDPDFVGTLSQRKLIPLLLDYVLRVQNHFGEVGSIFPEDKQIRIRLKVRRLSRMIISKCIQNEDERRSRLWMELCVAVLADGVFWNVFLLGRDQIPELVKEHVRNFVEKKSDKDLIILPTTINTSASVPNRADNSMGQGHDEVDNIPEKKVPIPFLLDNFLDRKDSLEQPDPITSRWRPTLKEIVDETELLYPLIQYLKHVGGQKALAYLQAVLDDSPDAREHCRRVLEIEYLPGFCRSNFFHEGMGLSRVEQGMEVITDGSPGMTRRLNKTHSRSASYGSKTNQGLSDILRIESGIVEGLPLYCSDSQGPSSSISSGFGSSSFALSSAANSNNDGVETDSSFFRRKQPLEDLIAKFLKDSITPHKQKSVQHSASDSSVSNISPKSLEGSPTKHSATPRMGIDAKSYKEWDDPEVSARVRISDGECDILRTTSDIVLSTISTNSWLSPVLSCWLNFFDPYLIPGFNHKLEEGLKQFLSLDLFITSVDLITDAFNYSGGPSNSYSDETLTHNSNPDTSVFNSASYHRNNKSNVNGTAASSTIPKPQNDEGLISSNHSSSVKPSPSFECVEKHNFSLVLQNLLKSLVDVFLTKVVNLDKFLSSLNTNRDYIFLFFVDVLDLLVFELFGDSDDIDERKEKEK